MGTVEWMQEFRSWAAAVISVMARAEYATSLASLSTTDRAAWRAELSAFADQGRLYLPNIRRDEYGQHKPRANQGYRSAVLDPVVAAVQVLSDQDYDESAYLNALRKHFVSQISLVLRPEKYNAKLARQLASTYRSDDKNDDPLDPHTVPAGSEALLQKISEVL
ncbi:hypothetical protein [Desulfovermiculus halophilus]|uniref:hypothetical protein n=1 Tax=Desulfovermiculus halophilus TaxID=339722 RepID=UPI0012946836|nr:hypothetical protein [Desulfovermiculus halophilus]